MTAAIATHGPDVIDLVFNNPDGIRLSQLTDIVSKRFGWRATFYKCSAIGMDLNGLLRFLETRDKARIKDGVVYPCGLPACEHGDI